MTWLNIDERKRKRTGLEINDNMVLDGRLITIEENENNSDMEVVHPRMDCAASHNSILITLPRQASHS